MVKEQTQETTLIDQMFSAGAHLGYSRSRRHPSIAPYIFGAKNRTEVFDLEKTSDMFDTACEAVESLGANRKSILFVGTKHEGRESIKRHAESLSLPFAVNRWIGGTLSNFPQIKKRIERLEKLQSERDHGELSKYTKKEQ